MSPRLSWQREESHLRLTGQLDQSTLSAFWPQRHKIMQGITLLDLGGLSRVDSAGLAMLVRLRASQITADATLKFIGISQQLLALITLYNLQSVLDITESARISDSCT